MCLSVSTLPSGYKALSPFALCYFEVSEFLKLVCYILIPMRTDPFNIWTLISFYIWQSNSLRYFCTFRYQTSCFSLDVTLKNNRYLMLSECKSGRCSEGLGFVYDNSIVICNVHTFCKQGLHPIVLHFRLLPHLFQFISTSIHCNPPTSLYLYSEPLGDFVKWKLKKIIN